MKACLASRILSVHHRFWLFNRESCSRRQGRTYGGPGLSESSLCRLAWMVNPFGGERPSPTTSTLPRQVERSESQIGASHESLLQVRFRQQLVARVETRTSSVDRCDQLRHHPADFPVREPGRLPRVPFQFTLPATRISRSSTASKVDRKGSRSCRLREIDRVQNRLFDPGGFTVPSVGAPPHPTPWPSRSSPKEKSTAAVGLSASRLKIEAFGGSY